MDDCINVDVASMDTCSHKIKTPYAKIFVMSVAENPYYSIQYFDPADGKFHTGFGSYCFDYVSKWLSEEFEITEGVDADDVELSRHGWWIFTKKHLWYKDENGDIDVWRYEGGFCNGPECQICHEAFCENCTPDWADTECETGHYYCSECAKTSRDAHENYCPNCGAKMDLPKQTDDGSKKDGYGIGIYA